jgi:hypothetical protein
LNLLWIEKEILNKIIMIILINNFSLKNKI